MKENEENWVQKEPKELPSFPSFLFLLIMQFIKIAGAEKVKNKME